MPNKCKSDDVNLTKKTEVFPLQSDNVDLLKKEAEKWIEHVHLKAESGDVDSYIRYFRLCVQRAGLQISDFKINENSLTMLRLSGYISEAKKWILYIIENYESASIQRCLDYFYGFIGKIILLQDEVEKKFWQFD